MGFVSCLCSVAQWLLKTLWGTVTSGSLLALPAQQSRTRLLTGATGVNVSRLSFIPNGAELFDMSRLGFLLQML